MELAYYEGESGLYRLLNLEPLYATKEEIVKHQLAEILGAVGALGIEVDSEHPEETLCDLYLLEPGSDLSSAYSSQAPDIQALTSQEGVIPFTNSDFLPLTVPHFVLAPAMRPYRPVLRFDASKFQGVGELQIFNQVYAHDHDGSFYANKVKRVMPDGNYGAKTPLQVALEDYLKYLQMYYKDLTVGLNRSMNKSVEARTYGLYQLSEEKQHHAAQHLLGASL